MSDPDFTWQLSESDHAYVREALNIGAAVKNALGETDDAIAMDALREKIDNLELTQEDQPVRTTFAHVRRPGDVYNTVSSPGNGAVIQLGDHTGDINLR